MKVCWLEQGEHDVPVENDWLSSSEAICMNALRVAKRRSDWRLGRWTAKRALAVLLNLPAAPEALARIEIRPAQSGEPEAFLNHQSAAVTISISHSAGKAVCAVAPPGVELGCDVETIEARSDAFISDYFTDSERAVVAEAPTADRSRLATLLWSAKESALKALHEGLRLDTRSVTVSLGDVSFDLNGWSPLRVCHDGGQVFLGWWQHSEGVVRTVVANSPADCPTELNLPAYCPAPPSRCA
jgi:4'-phosphopantetheinyl transferase